MYDEFSPSHTTWAPIGPIGALLNFLCCLSITSKRLITLPPPKAVTWEKRTSVPNSNVCRERKHQLHLQLTLSWTWPYYIIPHPKKSHMEYSTSNEDYYTNKLKEIHTRLTQTTQNLQDSSAKTQSNQLNNTRTTCKHYLNPNILEGIIKQFIPQISSLSIDKSIVYH